MKKLLICLFWLPVIAHAQAWQWGRSACVISNYWDSYSGAVVTDAQGNEYIAGSFYGDSIQFGTKTLYNSSRDPSAYILFLVKYDISGNVLWAWNPSSGCINNYASSLGVDSSGNIFMSGGFYGNQIIFGNDTLTNDTNPNGIFPHTQSMFLVKFDGTGHVIWARKPLSSSLDEVSGGELSIDAANNIYVDGSMLSTQWLAFGTDTLSNLSDEISEGFIAKYDANGNALWGRQTTNGDEYINMGAIASDPSGAVYAEIWFMTSVSFGGVSVVDSSWNYTNCIVKLNTSGDLQWLKQTPKNGSISGLTTDVRGNLYVAGNFTNTMVLGTDTLTDSFPQYPRFFRDTTEDVNMFVAKYDSSGNVLWARTVCGAITPACIITDKSGSIYLTGSFETAHLDSIHLVDSFKIGNYIFANRGESDIFLAKYSSSGDVVWAAVAGDSGGEGAESVAVDTSGNVYITGSFQSRNFVINEDQLGCGTVRYDDIFLAKLNPLMRASPTAISLPQKNISIYPNPATTSLTISSLSIITAITISNLLGQTCYTHQYNNEQVQVNVADLPKGIYFVKVNGSEVGKFVKD